MKTKKRKGQKEKQRKWERNYASNYEIREKNKMGK